jgi:hypothetical protein
MSNRHIANLDTKVFVVWKAPLVNWEIWKAPLVNWDPLSVMILFRTPKPADDRLDELDC